jgi:hypothetical protein
MDMPTLNTVDKQNMWFIESKNSRLNKSFTSKEEADQYIERMSSFFQTYYKSVYESKNPKLNRILNEGFIKGDLENILMPRISIDEYVPSDPETDNVVVAFFIKGVPEAVLPLKNFCEKSNGVLTVDYGDSDTIMDTSIIYCEFDRERLKIQNIHDLVIQISMIGSLNPGDFTMTFPHTNQKFPYEPTLMKQYFISRNRRKNLLAQRQAEKEAEQELEDMIKDMRRSREETEEEPVGESLENKIANLMFS